MDGRSCWEEVVEAGLGGGVGRRWSWEKVVYGRRWCWEEVLEEVMY